MFEHPLSSNECLAAGIVLAAASVFYLFMLCFRPGTLRRIHPMRHGDGPEKGAPVSRVSGFAMVILIGAFGFIIAADGYFHAITRTTGFRIIIPLFFLLVATGIFDSIRTRMRRRMKGVK